MRQWQRLAPRRLGYEPIAHRAALAAARQAGRRVDRHRPLTSLVTRISERLRRQRHHRRRAGAEPRQMRRRFRHHTLVEELGEDEFGVESRRALALRLSGQNRLDDARPHVAERGQAEEMHVVGRAGAGVVRDSSSAIVHSHIVACCRWPSAAFRPPR